MLGLCWEVIYNCYLYEVVVCFKVGEVNLVKVRVCMQSCGVYVYCIQCLESDVECLCSGYCCCDGFGRWWVCVCYWVLILGVGDLVICGIWGIVKVWMLRFEGKK